MCARWLAAFAALGCLSTFAPRATADNWNTGTGGNSARNGYVSALGPTTSEVLWQGGLPSQVALQAVIDGQVLVTTRIADISNKRDATRIVAQDLRNGDFLWDVALPIESLATDWHSRVSATRKGLVFVTRAGDTNAARIYALHLSDGSVAWRSADLIDESSTESLAFTADGDLIVGNFTSVMRIRAADGTTVWTTPRRSPSSDASSVAVFAGRLYVWEATEESGPCVTALDAATGQRLYSSDGIGGGFIQQLGLMVGPDGTIYAPRSQDNPETDFFVSLSDTGSRLVENWRIPLPYVPFASFGVGPDGSVYTYSPTNELLRLDPLSGDVLSRSIHIQSDFHQPRLAIGADGIIYLTNGGFADGRLYSFNADLSSRWSVSVPNVNTSGPCLGDDGILVVCGTGADVRAFASQGARCAPDWNRDGAFDSLDFFDFLNDFMAGHADFNTDGVTNSGDFFAFLEPFMNGC